MTAVLEKRAKSAPVVSIEVDLIDPSPFQARRKFDRKKLEQFAESIKKELFNPVHLRKIGKRYQLVAGEMRWRAVKDVLRWTHIDARIIECSDQEAAERCAEENFKKVEFLPSEKARQVTILLDQGFDPKRIATILGFELLEIEAWLQVAAMPESVQTMLDEKLLRLSAISVLAKIDGEEHRIKAAELASVGKLNQHELRARTDHYPKHQSARHVSSPVSMSSVKLVDLNRQIIALREDLRRLKPSSITVPSEKERIKENIGQLISVLQNVKQSLR